MPNPVKDKLYITGLASNKNVLRIFDAVGKCILSRDINSSDYTIDVSQYADGIYLLTIEAASGGLHRIKFTVIK